MDFLKRVPILIRLLFIVGGFLLGAFSSRLPDSLQTTGAFTGFVVMAFAIASLGIHRLVGWYRGMATSNESSPIPSANTARPLGADDVSIVRDVWLQDAVCYAVHGRWLGADEKAFSTDTQMNLASAIAQEMRQLAYDGKFNIWGKTSWVSVYELISQQFWADHQIDFLRLVGDEAKNAKTERTGLKNENQIYRELMVSKAQTETLWPPQSSCITSTKIPKLGKRLTDSF